ncbi:class I SAM-dependent methyltransferase [Hymenobacter busanensis]|uniref:Class I SAM-dependent methyltransferase n=1 Tax=Hymenobacter busanensis TaxID=2607656 RepID=A0A7L4ZU80_9BACT|nr:class I SAM-dependent methyltransferase [Hymenobacter busanensis]KAA9339527.1 class I SAM-dependent methyltransferase [Hymenobacter busanensis]QHJ06718.1 methyltransferase domain-containing protein [Hymenobacter busanensis]
MSSASTPHPDPVGNALSDYLAGQTAAELTVHSNVTEDESLAVRYFFRTLWEMPELERTALDECRGRVLDLGAGAGCHTLELQQRGFTVKAVDASPGAVATMQQRGVLEVACHDLLHLPEPGDQPFDTILMMMNGLGLVGSLDGLEQFLMQARAQLAPNGQILATSSDISYLFEDEDGALVLNLNGPYYGEVEYRFSYQNREGAPFGWLFADPTIVQDYAEAAGYDVEFLAEDDQQQFLVRLTLRS